MRTGRLVHAWLVLDFFGESRRSGTPGSTLTTAIFAQSFMALVFAALLYPETPPIAFAAANLTLSSLLLGIGGLDDVEQESRRRADEVLLASVPLSRPAVLLARVLHATFHLSLLTVGMALPPAILLAWLVHDAAAAPLYLLLACLCSGLAAGAIRVLLRAARRWLGAGRAALLAGSLKALLLAFGVVGFALSLRALRGTADALPIGRTGALLLPPYHAALWLAAPLANLGHLLLLLGLGAALLLLALGIGESQRAQPDRVGRGGPLERLDRTLMRGGPGLGLTAFVSTMLWRDPGFRARVLPLLGVPAAMVFLALQDEQSTGRELFVAMALQFPAIYLPFLIAFLPHADQPDAAWLFEQSPHAEITLARRAAFVSLATHVLLPIHALALATMLASGLAPAFAVSAGLFALGLALPAAAVQVRALRDLPFTVAGPGDASGDLGGLLVQASVLSLLGAGFGLSGPGLRWLGAALALAVGSAVLLRRR